MNIKSNKVSAIVLSRYNSSRLPGKALLEILDKPVLLYILERLLQVFDRSNIVVATSIESIDNPISDWCTKNNFNVFRGSLDNVAERFYEAAKSTNCDYAVRINGDNIFTDIPLLNKMKDEAINGNYNFLTNVHERTYPKGMSIEIIKLSFYLEKLEDIKKSEYHSEHVTSFLYEHPLNSYKYFYNTEHPKLSGIQLALDTKEDFDRTTKIISKFTKEHYTYNLKEIETIINEKR